MRVGLEASIRSQVFFMPLACTQGPRAWPLRNGVLRRKARNPVACRAAVSATGGVRLWAKRGGQVYENRPMPNSLAGGPSLNRVTEARAALSAIRPPMHGVTALQRGYADAIDAALQGALPSARGCTWIAVGSYGRRTLGPGSDIDLRMLVDQHDPHLEDLASVAFQSVWSRELSGGCQALTGEEWLELAAVDLTAATALLDARVVAGSEATRNELVARSRGSLFSAERMGAFCLRLEQECQSRSARYGSTVYLLEPDLRASPGGLRDIDVISWAASARLGCVPERAFASLLEARMLDRRGYEELVAAARFHRTLRCALHARVGRRADRLSFDAQEDVAALMNGMLVEQLMQQYYQHARVVARLRESVLDACASTGRADATQACASDARFVLRDGKLDVADDRAFDDSPLLALEAFDLEVRGAHVLHGELRERLIRSSADARWCERLRSNPDTGAIWARLLAQGAVVEELDDTGMLFAVVPEFAPVQGRAHHDVYHVYTVDVHSMAAVRMLAELGRGAGREGFELASRLAASGYDRRVLPLAVLLHDLGKGYPDEDGSRRNHAAVGSRMVPAIAARLGFSDDETKRVQWLVEQHLAFYKIATRRDVDAPETIADLLAVVADRRALVELYLLTVVDLETTSPGALNGWKLHVLDALFHRADEALRGESTAKGDSLNDAQRALLCATPPGEVGFYAAPHAQGADYIEVAVLLPDAPGALARVTGAFASADMEILGARINVAPEEVRGSSRAMDVFWCRRRGHKKVSLAHLKRLELAVRDCLDGHTPGTPKSPPSWQRRGPAVATTVRVMREAEGGCSVEVVAEDTPGLLHRLALGFFELGLDIQLAKINTEGARAIDVFYVSGASGKRIEDDAFFAIRSHLLAVIGPRTT